MLSDAFNVGPLLIKISWICFATAFISSYYVVKVRTANKNVADAFFNSVMLTLVIWKLSYIIVSPVEVLQHPIGILYFDGGMIGFSIGVFSSILYFAKKTRVEMAENVTFLIHTVYIALLIGMGAYFLTAFLFVQLFQFLLLFILSLAIYLFYNHRRKRYNMKDAFFSSSLWLLIGILFVDIIINKSTLFSTLHLLIGVGFVVLIALNHYKNK